MGARAEDGGLPAAGQPLLHSRHGHHGLRSGVAAVNGSDRQQISGSSAISVTFAAANLLLAALIGCAAPKVILTFSESKGVVNFVSRPGPDVALSLHPKPLADLCSATLGGAIAISLPDGLRQIQIRV
jgi:hypothetical protein